jgi:hypothetical protein
VAERVRLNVIVRAMSTTALAATLASCVVREAQPRVSWDEVCSHIQDRQDLETCRTKVRELGSAPAAQPAAGGIPVRTSLPWSGVLSWWVIYYGFGVILGRAVFVDARRRDWLVLQIRPIWWGALCVVDAAFGVLVYWMVHYSRLAPRFPSAPEPPERPRSPERAE